MLRQWIVRKGGNAVTTYGVAEITQTEGLTILEQRGEVDLDDLQDQLREIKDTISPLIAEEPAGAFGLESLQIPLTVGAQGKIWFKVSGSAEE